MFWPRERALIWGSWEGACSRKYGITEWKTRLVVHDSMVMKLNINM